MTAADHPNTAGITVKQFPPSSQSGHCMSDKLLSPGVRGFFLPVIPRLLNVADAFRTTYFLE